MSAVDPIEKSSSRSGHRKRGRRKSQGRISGPGRLAWFSLGLACGAGLSVMTLLLLAGSTSPEGARQAAAPAPAATGGGDTAARQFLMSRIDAIPAAGRPGRPAWTPSALEFGRTWSWCEQIFEPDGQRRESCYSLDPRDIDYQRIEVERAEAGDSALWAIVMECAHRDCISRDTRAAGAGEDMPDSWDHSETVRGYLYFRDNDDALRSLVAARKLLISQGASVSSF
ncbi:hypothetical protein [Poseidonocella sp. HB161398]|uniref:hypothetical protein n=1 Tax=Poseidonocella sp. HB161398 TaxID=2320855 RepID=UPI001107FA7B|nr:hypothetical protein [Poseidonocella sp. HB161398]